ncbi:hypothetical protein [Agrobacterium rosae]|uniref:hypothetical protein n=1 Tax=Agrobacterium rosae TaxID=1972867 RepID=UPI003A807AFF
MLQSFKREWLADIVESAPSIVFFMLLRFNIGLETAGWISAAFAAIVLVGFRAYKIRFSPLLLGINIHLLIITPLIVMMFHLGASAAGETVTTYSHKGVLITILLVGIALTIFSQEGFIGLEGLSKSAVRNNSTILLIATVVAIAWAFTYSGTPLFGIVLPIIGLFILRRFLGSRKSPAFER